MAPPAPELRVRAATRADRDAWLAMRERLWPAAAGEPSDHPAEVDAFFAGDARIASVVLLAFPSMRQGGRARGEADASDALRDDEAAGLPIGFAELAIRPWVDGCATDRVCYLEGWYVEPAWRRRGVGAALVRAAEAWGRAQGCREMGSDTAPDNADSLAAHARLGFEETGRAVLLRKDLVRGERDPEARA